MGDKNPAPLSNEEALKLCQKPDDSTKVKSKMPLKNLRS